METLIKTVAFTGSRVLCDLPEEMVVMSEETDAKSHCVTLAKSHFSCLLLCPIPFISFSSSTSSTPAAPHQLSSTTPERALHSAYMFHSFLLVQGTICCASNKVLTACRKHGS